MMQVAKEKAFGLLSSFKYDYKGMEGSVDVSFIMDTLYYVFAVFFVSDYIFRVFSTVRLVFTFWSQGTFELPVVDVSKVKKKADSAQCAYFLNLIVSPFLAFLLMFIVSIFIFYAIAVLYTSMFQAYMDGCVNSQRGTLVSLNTNAIAYNFASASGTAVMALGMTAFEVQRNKLCADNLASAFVDVSTDQASIQGYLGSFKNSSAALALMDRCLDTARTFPNGQTLYVNTTTGYVGSDAAPLPQ